MSATDPVRNVTHTSQDHPVLTDIDESLKRHAAYPPSTGGALSDGVARLDARRECPRRPAGNHQSA